MAVKMCRVCLAGNIRLISVKNKKHKEVYRKLTNSKLSKDAGKDKLCYICHSQLIKCSRFADMAMQSEASLQKRFKKGLKIKQKSTTLLDHSLSHNLSVRPVQYLTLSEEEIPVKTEHEDYTMNFQFLDIKASNFENSDNTDDLTPADVDFDVNSDSDFSDTKSNKLSEPNYVYCDFCNKRFPYKYRLMVHLRTHMEKPKRFKCSKCDKAFMSQSTLNYHIQMHDEETFSCKICSETYPSKTKLTSHILSHTGDWQFQCDKCQKAFTKPADLKRHETQSHAISHTCTVCNKEFNKSASLKAHMLTHTAKRVHVCNICDKAFSVPASLKRHIHTHTEERPTFPCDKCSKIYTHKHHLSDHLRTHNGEKPYTCKICDKSFSYASTLRNHMVIHTGEKPFVCYICNSPFSQSSTLRRHLKLIHDIK